LLRTASETASVSFCFFRTQVAAKAVLDWAGLNGPRPIEPSGVVTLQHGPNGRFPSANPAPSFRLHPSRHPRRAAAACCVPGQPRGPVVS
jgi:hypothetical protein